MKLAERETGEHHVSADIGCHLFAINAPFDLGATTMGYGLGSAGAAALSAPGADRRTVAFMGDGGFWHNGLTSGVGNAVFNKHDQVLVVVDNAYAAATGGQDLLSSQARARRGRPSIRSRRRRAASASSGPNDRQHLRRRDVRDTFIEALTTDEQGPKVLVMQSECQLNRQRRVKPETRQALKEATGHPRAVRRRSGDMHRRPCLHPDLRVPVADNHLQPRSDADRPGRDGARQLRRLRRLRHNAHAAVLCPSFYRSDVIHNPTRRDRLRVEAARLVDEAARRAASRRTPRDSSAALMASWYDGRRPLTLAILALGGEGGGVLADWIVAVAENAGYYAQNTSVAGVAQRTGATVYYVEIFPPDAADPGANGVPPVRTEPMLSIFATPGEVDVVIASELMECGRAIQRGFATPDRTTLITSTNRVYSIDEKIAMGDGRVDTTSCWPPPQRSSKRLIAADFVAIADEAGRVISASLFGALGRLGRAAVHAASSSRHRSGRSARASRRRWRRSRAGFDAATTPAAPSMAAPPRRPRCRSRRGPAPRGRSRRRRTTRSSAGGRSRPTDPARTGRARHCARSPTASRAPCRRRRDQ